MVIRDWKFGEEGKTLREHWNLLNLLKIQKL